MRKPHGAAPKETAEEKRFRAKALACRIAESNNIDPAAVRHLTDTVIGEPCFVVTADDSYAVVVYDRDPEIKFCIVNRPGRLADHHGDGAAEGAL